MTTIDKLEIVKKIQKKYPKIHLGGSLALFVYGVDLGREPQDIDLNSDDDEFDQSKCMRTPIDNGNPDTGESGWQFSYAWDMGDFKIELAVEPGLSLGVRIVYYLGYPYRLTDIMDVLQFKEEYAEKGSEKHRADCVIIKQFLKGMA